MWLAFATGCGAERVEARAIWVDDTGGDGRRVIHVYDRGELESFEVLGDSEPNERVLLDPRGRGVLIRTGDRRGAWFDLDDGRRLPLLLPSETQGFNLSNIQFGDRALFWLDGFPGSLTVVPLAAGLALPRNDDGTVEPLGRGSGLTWMVAAEQAPIVFAANPLGGRASFFRYPTRADQPLVIALEAEAEGLSLPSSSLFAAVEPRGELAIYPSTSGEEQWEIFERRSPTLAGPLELPPSLAEIEPKRLLAVIDRATSVWTDGTRLHRFDRLRGTVDSLPIVAPTPAYWLKAEQGRAVIVAATSGPVYRADLDELRPVSLESTECQGASVPIVSPSGRWVAWTCTETSPDVEAALGSAVLRVSEAGLERYVGVSMATLAIDDDGDLLLYSSITVDDTLDVIGSTVRPRSLFVLSGDGVLTRINKLEPAPAPVLVKAIDLNVYIQGAALVGDR